jgi:hypothetical protein
MVFGLAVLVCCKTTQQQTMTENHKATKKVFDQNRKIDLQEVQMNSTGKILLGLIAGIAIVCLVAVAAGLILTRSAGVSIGKALQSDPAQAGEVTKDIADYDLPADFGEPYAREIAGFDLVSYTGQDGHSHIMFFQLPEGVELDPAEMERQLDEVAGSTGSAGLKTAVVEQYQATLRGQETTLVVSEGVNHDGQAFRQVTGIFQGNGGQALVVFERPASAWDPVEVEAFLASIR